MQYCNSRHVVAEMAQRIKVRSVEIVRQIEVVVMMDSGCRQ